MNIEWAPDEDGSIDHGMEYHREEESGFLSLIDAATPAIEVGLIRFGGHLSKQVGVSHGDGREAEEAEA